MTHLWPEIAPAAINPVFGMPARLSSLQVLSVDLGTEIGPAISLVYEGAERNIMKRAPRNVNVDKLISAVYWHHGSSTSELFMTGDDFWHANATQVCASKTIECFSGPQQEQIARVACAAWFVALEFCQFFHHGIASNPTMLYGAFMEPCVLVVLVYVPGVQDVIGAAAVGYVPWLVGLGSGLLTWCYSEGLERLARRHPQRPLSRGETVPTTETLVN